MKITRVEVTPCLVPRKEPIKSVFGLLAAHEHVIVCVELEDGTRGFGEASPLPWNSGESNASVTEVLRHHFGPAALGCDVLAPAQVTEQLDRSHFTRNPTARAALEFAVLDARARVLGQPAHRLLGGFADSVECSAILGSGSAETVAAEAVDLRSRLGVNSFKLKAGVDMEAEVDVVHAVREALGPAALLYADANQGYSPREAADFLARTATARLAWIEEPCAATQLAARRHIAASALVPILGDETCGDVDSAVRAITSGASTMISIKPARTGLSHSEELAAYCRTTATPVVVGCTGESALGIYGSAAFAAARASTQRLPAELTMYLDMAVDVVAAPAIVDGRLQLPSEPGLSPAVSDDMRDDLAVAGTYVVS